MVLKQRPERPAAEDSARADLLNRIISLNVEKIVPIIGNSFRIDQIFCDEKRLSDFFTETPDFDEEGPTIEEQLTEVWAREIRYPMLDVRNLARVAQFYQVQNEDSDLAKKEYLQFLKSYLLDMSSGDKADTETVENLRSELRSLSFSDIVRDLKYPRFPPETEDPLNLLAKLPFPVYITTSHYDFLERALIKEGRKRPRTEVVRWGDRKYVGPEETHPEPTVGEPVVYHLFGLESDPGSLVISEDDYLKFLVSVVSDTNTLNPVVPLRLQHALAQSHLLLLGYRLKDWDFRVLFRFILSFRMSKSAKKGIFIQIKPKRGDQHLLDYLKHYFNVERFEIEWKSSERFIQDLWRVWKGHQ
jgi:SIR2-like protein